MMAKRASFGFPLGLGAAVAQEEMGDSSGVENVPVEVDIVTQSLYNAFLSLQSSSSREGWEALGS